MSDVYFLKGQKIGLRAMRREDLPVYQEWLNSKDVTKYLEMGWRPYSERDLEAVYKEAVGATSAIVFVVCDLKTDKPIGTAGLYFLHWPGRRAQYRILLGKPEKYGKGIGTEVTRLILKHGFERLNMNTIYLGVNAENAGAIKAYEKCGFVHEGTQREFIYNNGRYYDCVNMSILARDYFKT